jgi:hypothetical protein
MIQAQSTWSSLEITKLVIGTLTPLVLVFLGIWVNRIAKRVEAAQWANQKLIEKRIAIFDELAPLINDLYCFFMCIGNWKERTPPEVVEIKRKLDKKVYIYASLFSPEFKGSYTDFINFCFLTFSGSGQDAQLLTLIDHPIGGDRRKSAVEWRSEWVELFAKEEKCTPVDQIGTAYENLMTRFSQELGVIATTKSKE